MRALKISENDDLFTWPFGRLLATQRLLFCNV